MIVQYQALFLSVQIPTMKTRIVVSPAAQRLKVKYAAVVPRKSKKTAFPKL